MNGNESLTRGEFSIWREEDHRWKDSLMEKVDEHTKQLAVIDATRVHAVQAAAGAVSSAASANAANIAKWTSIGSTIAAILTGIFTYFWK